MQRFKLVAMAVFISLALSACSSKLAYDNLDWLLPWYLDDYIEFEGEQESRVKQRLVETLNWHRQQQLPIYIDDLNKLEKQLRQPTMTPQQWLNVIDTTYNYWHTIREQFIDDLVMFAPELNQAQVDGLFAQLESRNLEREESLQESNKQERLDERQERVLERIVSFTGDLDPSQVDKINGFVARIKPTSEIRLEYLREYQSILKQTFAESNSSNLVAKLAPKLKNPDNYKSARYQGILVYNQSVFANMLSELFNSLTPPQKDHLLTEVADLRKTLTALAENKS